MLVEYSVLHLSFLFECPCLDVEIAQQGAMCLSRWQNVITLPLPMPAPGGECPSRSGRPANQAFGSLFPPPGPAVSGSLSSDACPVRLGVSMHMSFSQRVCEQVDGMFAY